MLACAQAAGSVPATDAAEAWHGLRTLGGASLGLAEPPQRLTAELSWLRPGLVWTRLGWVELSRARLGFAGLGWAGLARKPLIYMKQVHTQCVGEHMASLETPREGAKPNVMF